MTAAGMASTGGWTLRRVAILAVLILLCEVVILGYNLVIPALTEIATTFGTTNPVLTITLYTLFGATGAPLLGKLADLRGKRFVLLMTGGFLTGGAVIAALAPTLALFLAGRGLEGVGLAALPLAYSLARDLFPTRIVPLAIALVASGTGLVTVAGPLLAGYLIDTHGFRSVFWTLAGASAVAAVLVLVVVPESPVRALGRLDVLGAGLLAVGVGLLILAAGLGEQWGWTSPRLLAMLVVSVATLAGWWWHSRKAREPLVDLEILRRPAMRTAMMSASLLQPALAAVGTLLTISVMTPASLGLGYGFGEDAAGVSKYTSIAGATTVFGGVLLGVLARRFGIRRTYVVGAGLIGIGAAVLALLPPATWQVILAYAVLGIGGGMVFSAIPNLVVLAVPPARLGVGSSTASTIQTLASTVGLQLIFVLIGQIAGGPTYTAAAVSAGFAVCAAFAFGAGVVGRHTVDDHQA